VLAYLSNLLYQTFQQTEAESASYLATRGKRLDGKLFLIATLTAVNLSLIHYFQDTAYLFEFLRNTGASALADSWSSSLSHSPHAQLIRLGWWAALILFFYLIIPVLFIRFVLKEKLIEYGVRIKGAFKDIQLYLLMLLVMIPLVLYFSGTASFQARYPFYELKTHEPLFPDFIIWELLYLLQFVSLEFFFRGFLLHGLKQRFGFYSILVMVIPYCMIHFGKPLPETLAAILAGIVLGILSLKSRSILLGIVIHYSVALTMDLCALWQKGFWNHS
jgi:membrane protease YdiL (CAAX protease family)